MISDIKPAHYALLSTNKDLETSVATRISSNWSVSPSNSWLRHYPRMQVFCVILRHKETSAAPFGAYLMIASLSTHASLLCNIEAQRDICSTFWCLLNDDISSDMLLRLRGIKKTQAMVIP
jgi:hypothetical protein